MKGDDMRKLGWVAAALLAAGCGKKKEPAPPASSGSDPVSLALTNAKRTKCASQLKQLWLMENQYVVSCGGPQRRFPVETGGAFWLKLSQPSSRLIEESEQEIYACPFKTPRRDATDYRGPASDVNRMMDGDAVGACIGNHPDGSAVIVRKSGDIMVVKEGDALCQKAMETTKP